jgi:hypothetical protein
MRVAPVAMMMPRVRRRLVLRSVTSSLRPIRIMNLPHQRPDACYAATAIEEIVRESTQIIIDEGTEAVGILLSPFLYRLLGI